MLRFLQWLSRQERLLRAARPLFGPFHPLLPEHRRDPHASWRTLRETAPVYRSRVFGSWVCTRYEDVQRVLRDGNFSSDRSEVPAMKLIERMSRRDPSFAAMIQRSLLSIDGSEHRRLRGLVSKAFTPRRIERLRPQLQGIVDDLLDRAAEKGEMELVDELAHPLPVIAIAELLGVPADDRELFRGWSAELVQLLDPFQGRGGAKSLRRAARGIFDYFRPLLEERRAEPRDDLLSAMIAAEHDGERLEELDLLALSSLLLVAGHETTSNLIGNAVISLLRFPDEHKRLQDDPSLICSAVDEFLRYESPIQLTDRAVLADCEIGGQRIRKGQLVAVVLAPPTGTPRPSRNPTAWTWAG
jgi:cytochrome P450